MTAIILAAGIGKRMGQGALPKCLQQVGGRTLLRRTLDSLRSTGVKKIILVVGFRADEVVREAKLHAQGLELIPLTNPRFSEGAILSLWTAREHLHQDVLIMDADVLFPPVFLELLVRSKHANCLLVDGSSPDTGEEQVVLGKEERVFHITKRPDPELKREMKVFGESIGFLKLSFQTAQCLRQLLDSRVQAGIVNIEHEQVYPELFKAEIVGFERVDGQAWTEIDTPEDLSRAEQEIFPRWSPPPCINRQISNFFLPGVLQLPFTPNQWTTFSFLVGFLGLKWIAFGTPFALWVGALLFQLCYLIDNWDGDVARTKGLSSRWGGWYDVLTDGILHTLLPLAMAAGLAQRLNSGFAWVLGGLAAFGVGASFLVTLLAKVRGFGFAIHSDPARIHASWSDPPLKRWILANLTNENLSLFIVLILILDLRRPFLWMMAVGSQIFWIQYLWKERKRLFTAWPKPADSRQTY